MPIRLTTTNTRDATRDLQVRFAAARMSPAQRAAVQRMINDANGDGAVSVAERFAYVQEIGANLDTVDRNRDGRVTFEEELRYAVDQGKVSLRAIENLLRRDTNRDGRLTPRERRTAKPTEPGTGPIAVARFPRWSPAQGKQPDRRQMMQVPV